MKDYKNVAEDVFRRSGEVIEENKRRRRKLAEIGVSAACWAAVGAVGFGVWKTNFDGKNIKTVDPQSSTSQGDNVSLINSDPLSADTSNPNSTINEFIDYNGVDIRCIPRHSNVMVDNGICTNTYITDAHYNVNILGVWHGDSIDTGDVMFSSELAEALDKFGRIKYNVIIGYYKNSEWVEPTMELFESERDKFGVNFYFDTDSNGKHYLGIQNADYELLKNIVPSSEYGYCIDFRGNFFNYMDIEFDKCIYNHGDHTASFELVGADFCKIRGSITNIDANIKEPKYSPDNGTAIISESLKKAIETYGKEDKNGEIDYRVIIEYYKDGERIDSSKELWESEYANGVKSNFESNGSDFGKTWEHYIWRTMTADELESFMPSAEYGYVLHLYNAYFEYEYKYDDNIINGLYNNGVYF